ncbi:MAG: hypothetical protein QOD93_6832 [Acetobacteraceae bacterium]|nr:hypothetical protein [Acetobacteraceae bacterium]
MQRQPGVLARNSPQFTIRNELIEELNLPALRLGNVDGFAQPIEQRLQMRPREPDHVHPDGPGKFRQGRPEPHTGAGDTTDLDQPFLLQSLNQTLNGGAR